jgi:5-hydroxyisourate hydrolase
MAEEAMGVSVSTHVLDAVSGRPAAGLRVGLAGHDGAAWTELARAETDADGRIGRFPGGDLPAGVYQLTFETEGYLAVPTFYPVVVIVFRITDQAAHYHVPLLLSPYAYSTYRGS